MGYYLLQNNETKGPYSLGQVRSMWNSGAVTADTEYCEEGYEQWKELSEISDQLETNSTQPTVPPRIETQSDYCFLNEGGICVTKTRFMASGQTFAMAGITSVSDVEVAPSTKGPMTLGAFSFLAFPMSLFVGIAGFVLGFLMIVGAIAWVLSLKPTFSVVLTTAGGEVTAYSSNNSRFISRVVDALHEAIIARG